MDFCTGAVCGFTNNTTLRMTTTTVLNYAQHQGWTVTEQSSGVETRNLGQSPAQVVGKRAIKAHLGGYQGVPWWIDVLCYWAFDQNDELIEVFVSKQVDAP